MAQAYLFCLVLGGGLAVLSILGDVLDLGADEVDAAVDPGGGADVADADLDAAEATAGDVDSDAEKIFSLRGLVYGLFGFGLTGTVLGWLGFPPAGGTTVGLSAGAGLMSGWLTARVVGWIRRSESGARQGEGSFEGRVGRVVLPVGRDSPGRVRVRRGTRTYDLRARAYEAPEAGEDTTEWDEVVVVEMRDGIAYVAPVEDGELRLSS